MRSATDSVYLWQLNDKYSALIPAREAKGKYRPGKILELRVSEVKEDGKMKRHRSSESISSDQ